MIEGAESSASAKDKLQFLSYAMLLYSGAKPTKKKIKDTMSSEMKLLLGMADKEENH